MSQASYVVHINNSIKTVMQREWCRVLKEPSRIVGISLQPLLFLVVFGLGFHETFVLKEQPVDYVTFFYPGILGLVLLFSSIYATLTLVEDKKCGFFRLVLIAPGGKAGAILGKIVATATLGFLQGLSFLALLIFLPMTISLAALMWTLALLLVGSFTLSTIGVLFAWISPSSSAFHALMSVVLIPMWLLSGAMFPLKGPLICMSYLNPMAYLVSGLRDTMIKMDSPIMSMVLLVLFFMVSITALTLVARRYPIE